LCLRGSNGVGMTNSFNKSELVSGFMCKSLCFGQNNSFHCNHFIQLKISLYQDCIDLGC
jgi:hypothetical protein